MRNRRLPYFVAVGASVALFACAQGEKERCQVDDDCSSPLVCVNASTSVGAVPPDPGDVDVLDEAVGGHCCPTCTTGLPKWDTGRDACSCGGTAPPTEDGGVDGGDGSAPGAGGDASDGDAADATEADVADATDADGSADA